jgi:hypothetical protein
MQKYLELPEASKEMHRLDNKGFLRQGLKKMGKRFESYKATARQLEVNLILNDISLGRRSAATSTTWPPSSPPPSGRRWSCSGAPSTS